MNRGLEDMRLGAVLDVGLEDVLEPHGEGELGRGLGQRRRRGHCEGEREERPRSQSARILPLWRRARPGYLRHAEAICSLFHLEFDVAGVSAARIPRGRTRNCGVSRVYRTRPAWERAVQC